MKRLALIAALVLLVGTAAQVNAGPFNPVVEYSSSQTLADSRPFTLGYKFSTTTTFNIDALAYWVDGLGNNHQVGIWDTAGSLLVSTTVLGSTDPIQGHFQYHAISNFSLAPGTYTIGGEFLGNIDPFPSQATGVTTLAGYTWVTDEQQFGSGLNFPTLSTGGSYGDNGILAVTFSTGPNVVPEPGSLTLLGVAAASLLGYCGLRRRQKTAIV
jgi:hypothetical protein